MVMISINLWGLGQDSTSSFVNKNTVIELGDFVSISPSQSNKLNNPPCGQLCGGSQDYHIRTGFIGFDETADALPNYSSDPNWTVTFTPAGCSSASVDMPPYVWPYVWGDMNIDIDGDGTEEEYRALRPFGCLELGYYEFETKFCITSDATGMSIDLKCFADNNAEVYLNDVLIGGHTSSTVYGFTTPNLLSISNSAALVTGENVLKVRVANFSIITQLPQNPQEWFVGPTSSIGLAVYANVKTTTGCVTCCNNGALITGAKFMDVNGDGILQSTEPAMEGITINLLNSSGAILETTTTNAEGYFSFYVDAGTGYQVQEVSPMTNTYPGTGIYTGIDMDPYEILNNVLFLNTPYDIQPCEGCGTSFAPIPGETYWFSAWVNVDVPESVLTYNVDEESPFLQFIFLGSGAAPMEFYPTGEIVDGWQRVVGKFTIPAGTENIVLNLHANPYYDTYFDDIRIHPFNSSMKSYVYDGETFWLVAELDDNNYATYYEYDEEGGLIRIKKETARGIVTIQETRSNTTKE